MPRDEAEAEAEALLDLTVTELVNKGVSVEVRKCSGDGTP